MTAEDIDRVHLIDKLSFSLPWPAASYRYELFENPASILHVIEIRQEDGADIIVGMSVSWLIVDEAHIATIAVHPNFRHMGLGRILLYSSLQEAIRRGGKLATLEVRQGNLAAMNLYQRFGFQVEGRRPRYYHDTNEDAIIMTVTGLDEAYLHRISEYVNHKKSLNGGMAWTQKKS
jgi:[ribosomal protein S18]-alanine N-acetyltransferase